LAEKDQLIGEQVTEISRLQKLLKNKDKELAETSRKIEDLEATKNKKEEEHVAEVRSFSELLEQKGNQIQTLSDALRTARGRERGTSKLAESSCHTSRYTWSVFF